MNTPVAVGRTNTRAGSVHQVPLQTRYAKSLDSSGWLRIRLEPSGEQVYLCEYVKVTILEEGERTHFLIMEGIYAKKKASLATKNATACLVQLSRGNGAQIVATIEGRRWLVSKIRHNEERNQLLAILNFNGKKAVITLDSDLDYFETNPLSPDAGKRKHSKPLPKGVYKIMAPEFPKDASMTRGYAQNPGGYPQLAHHTVWFPIEYAPNYNSNFVHVGHLSEGCVTMYDLTMWNDLYDYLISNRLDKEGKYVGTITIK